MKLYNENFNIYEIESRQKGKLTKLWDDEMVS